MFSHLVATNCAKNNFAVRQIVIKFRCCSSSQKVLRYFLRVQLLRFSQKSLLKKIFTQISAILRLRFAVIFGGSAALCAIFKCKQLYNCANSHCRARLLAVDALPRVPFGKRQRRRYAQIGLRCV